VLKKRGLNLLYKKFTLIALIIVLLTAWIPFKVTKAENNDPPQITVSAQAAVLMDQKSGRVLFGKDVHKKLRIASITKVMTAILAIESGKLDEKVTVSNNAYGTEGSSIYLKKGEKITLRNLVYGLLLRSGNDSAVAIAEKVGGSEDGFVYLMNKKARELGMLDTHFANPHGLDDHENHYSSAYDMALLTRYAMKNPEFQKIFGAKYHTAPNPGEKWDRRWKNKNKLLFRYQYSTGGKTGFTKRAGRTLISTASKGNMDLVVVTLNDGDDWKDHQNLFNWGFENYHMVRIVKKGKVTGIKKSFYKGRLYTHRDLTLPLTNSEKESLKTEVTLYKPLKGERWKNPPLTAGHLDVFINDNLEETIPLFFDKPPKEKHGFWTSFSHIFSMILGFYSHG
jgi:serine-type D-Ala-D-Ala carboxypeptidase (penicillin-binding protein 5/6)